MPQLKQWLRQHKMFNKPVNYLQKKLEAKLSKEIPLVNYLQISKDLQRVYLINLITAHSKKYYKVWKLSLLSAIHLPSQLHWRNPIQENLNNKIGLRTFWISSPFTGMVLWLLREKTYLAFDLYIKWIKVFTLSFSFSH